MKNRYRSQADMFTRVRHFGVTYRHRFAETSTAHASFAIVDTELAQIERLAVAEHVASRSVRAVRKADARQQLQAAQVRAANTAWVLSRTTPELGDHADAPPRMGDRQLLTFGRGFLAAAAPHAAHFAAHDIAIEGLGKHVEAFEAVVAETATRRDELTQTRGLLKAALKRALEAVDTLDVTVANTFASDADVLALWKRERRVEVRRLRGRVGARPALREAVAPAAAADTVAPEAPMVTDATATKAA